MWSLSASSSCCVFFYTLVTPFCRSNYARSIETMLLNSSRIPFENFPPIINRCLETNVAGTRTVQAGHSLLPPPCLLLTCISLCVERLGYPGGCESVCLLFNIAEFCFQGAHWRRISVTLKFPKRVFSWYSLGNLFLNFKLLTVINKLDSPSFLQGACSTIELSQFQ